MTQHLNDQNKDILSSEQFMAFERFLPTGSFLLPPVLTYMFVRLCQMCIYANVIEVTYLSLVSSLPECSMKEKSYTSGSAHVTHSVAAESTFQYFEYQCFGNQEQQVERLQNK